MIYFIWNCGNQKSSKSNKLSLPPLTQLVVYILSIVTSHSCTYLQQNKIKLVQPKTCLLATLNQQVLLLFLSWNYDNWSSLKTMSPLFSSISWIHISFTFIFFLSLSLSLSLYIYIYIYIYFVMCTLYLEILNAL